jgi:hypothetical protein
MMNENRSYLSTKIRRYAILLQPEVSPDMERNNF